MSQQWCLPSRTAYGHAGDLSGSAARGEDAGRIADLDRLEQMPHVRVSQLGADLCAYLDLGYDVRCAGNGWAMLCSGDSVFVLVPANLPAASPTPPPVRLQIVGTVAPGPAELCGSAELELTAITMGQLEQAG